MTNKPVQPSAAPALDVAGLGSDAKRLRVLIDRIDEWEGIDTVESNQLAETLLLDIKECLVSITYGSISDVQPSAASALDVEPIRQRIKMAQRIFGVSFDGYPDINREAVDIQRDRDRSALLREVERLAGEVATLRATLENDHAEKVT